MSVTRRTRLSLIAAAASGALVVTMAGTALASGHVDRPSCSDLVPAFRSDDTHGADTTPATTPATATP